MPKQKPDALMLMGMDVLGLILRRKFSCSTSKCKKTSGIIAAGFFVFEDVAESCRLIIRTELFFLRQQWIRLSTLPAPCE